MLHFNSCPRCQTGTIEVDSDNWGRYILCLMCGYQHDIEEGVDARAVLLKLRSLVRAASDAVAAREQDDTAAAA